MSLKAIFQMHKVKFIFTLCLILIEASIALLFPLFIGYAIDDSINGGYEGAMQLGFLGIAALIFGVGRRVFDSRFYAQVYREIGQRVIANMRGESSSRKSARLSMIGELVEFLENSLPELINNVIALVGVILIIAVLNLNVFYTSIFITAAIFLIYKLSSDRTIAFNRSSNDELEKQVDILSSRSEQALSLHLQKMMKWNIKLSDLEAMNFSFSWICLIGFLVASIIISSSEGIIQYGVQFSLVMYVFQYMENVVSLPLFYQNWLRLKEIRNRIGLIK